MKNINFPPRTIIAVSIRLILTNTLADYYPAMESPEIRQFVTGSLYESLPDAAGCLDMKQFLDEIILLFDGASPACYRVVPQLKEKMDAIMEKCQEEMKRRHWTRKVSYVMAADAGLSAKSTLFSDTGTPIGRSWSGLHTDRVSSLTGEMASGTYPAILITHAYYKRLPPQVQETFTTLYYIHHICCYEKNHS